MEPRTAFLRQCSGFRGTARLSHGSKLPRLKSDRLFDVVERLHERSAAGRDVRLFLHHPKFHPVASPVDAAHPKHRESDSERLIPNPIPCSVKEYSRSAGRTSP